MSPAVPASAGVWKLIADVGIVGKLILLLLLAVSVLSWAVMAQKFRRIKKIIRKNRAFRKAFRKCHSLIEVKNLAGKYEPSTLTGVFKIGYEELLEQNKRIKNRKKEQSSLPFDESGLFDLPSFERALSRGKKLELENLRNNLALLASAGSVSPFIGLFGTVWGIMDAFREIGVHGSASLAVVAPGISEALIATAAGLFVAIPAVVGYNYFNEKIRSLSSGIDDFCLELVNIMTRLLKESYGKEGGG